jgi:hypothetical protein
MLPWCSDELLDRAEEASENALLLRLHGIQTYPSLGMHNSTLSSSQASRDCSHELNNFQGVLRFVPMVTDSEQVFLLESIKEVDRSAFVQEHVRVLCCDSFFVRFLVNHALILHLVL